MGEPQEFVDKWGCDRKTLQELLDLESAQVNGWFVDPNMRSYRSPKQMYKNRLDEIDLILQLRKVVDPYSPIAQSLALQRIDRLIPEFPDRIRVEITENNPSD